MLIWGTGAIDFSQPETAEEAKVVPNDYHLTSKIDLSREHFAAAAHDQTPVLALIPAGQDAERAATILRKVLGQQPHHIEIVANLADVIRPIEAFLRKGDFTAPPEMKYAPVPYTPPPEAAEENRPRREGRRGRRREDRRRRSASAAAPAAGRCAASARFGRARGRSSSASAGQSGGATDRALGGVAVALIAVIGVGAMMLRAPPGPQAGVAPGPGAMSPPPRPPRRTRAPPASWPSRPRRRRPPARPRRRRLRPSS